jgi:GGDEF domain-containing protein
MKNKFVTAYGIVAFIILLLSVAWFVFSVSGESYQGKLDADRSFSWIYREAGSSAVSDGFMSNEFIRKMTEICRQSRLLSAVVISTPSGAVFAWPETSDSIQYDLHGKPQIINSSIFMKVYSSALDIGNDPSGSTVLTAVIYTLHPDAVFSASRNSFFVILALLLVTLIVIVVNAPEKDEKRHGVNKAAIIPPTEGVSLTSASKAEIIDDTAVTMDLDPQDEISVESSSVQAGDVDRSVDFQDETPMTEGSSRPSSRESASVTAEQQVSSTANGPEGLFSPVTGTGWEQYLCDRLDAELVRAASSEQDLSLIILRVSGLLHTDLLSRKIAKVLLDTFKFKDMVFEFGSNGFAGILQNYNLDQAMKTADELYAGIDSILMDMAFDGQITIGITTRTARLLDAKRMIEEAYNAARKAEEEPSLPIVAFRANPERYRNFVAENN